MMSATVNGAKFEFFSRLIMQIVKRTIFFSHHEKRLYAHALTPQRPFELSLFELY